jgi:hypothetical protein
MQLWTDYEGVTLDGAFPLQKLLMPEGRSAFFSTAGPQGEPTVVRLIECHFDEEEILNRWRCLEALSHPNFVKFEHFGQTVIDGRPVVYAVFEKVDANLAEVLDQGPLTVQDVEQLASSLVAALDALHPRGFIHGHIEPRNVFAVGAAVKLRSDCIGEAPEGEEGRAAKQRDVRDLATLLLQGLTQRRSVEGIPDSAMPPPFGRIIRNGLDGAWGLEDIKVALDRHFGSQQPAASKPANAAPATAAVTEQKAPSAVPTPSPRPQAQFSLPLLDEDQDQDRNAGFARASRKDTWGVERSFSLRSVWLPAVFVALVLLSTWVIAHTWNAYRHEATQAAAVSQPATQIPASPAPQSVAVDSPRVNVPASAGSRADWRVIAFTYNRRADAENKVSSLARSHPELQPVVFTPNGRAPYLVSLGGVMDRDAAYALARHSRSLGLPRDMYAQNYSH